MKSLQWAIALGGMILLSTASAWSAESRVPPQSAGTVQKAAQTAPAEPSLFAQNNSRKACVDPIKACWKVCGTQNKPGSDAWKACRAKCGDPGGCD